MLVSRPRFDQEQKLVYREAGFDIAKDIITFLFQDRINAVKPTDPKTELQEIMHAVQATSPLLW